MAVAVWNRLDAELADTIEGRRIAETRAARRRRCVYCGVFLSNRNRNGIACQHHYRVMMRDPNYGGGVAREALEG